MATEVASIEVTLRLLGSERFQAGMRESGSVTEQTGARVKRAMDGIASSTDRVSAASMGLTRTDRGLQMVSSSALRAELSITGLSRSFTLLGTAVGGLAGGVALNAFKNYADTATNIQNRLAAVIPVQSQRAAIDQQIFDTAQRTRTSYEATANIFSRMSLSASTLGASQSEILRAVEITQKALQAGGATSSESASIATQLSQALGSGKLAGDELKSIAENSPVLIQAIAREFGVSVGALKDMGAQGELVSERVFKAILNAGKEVDEVFARTTPTIAAGIQQIDNALTRYIGNVDKSLGVTKALVGGLEFVAKNLDTIGDSAALAVAALAGPLGARLLGGAGSRVAAPFRAAGADAREGLASATGAVAAARAAREAAQVELQQAERALAALESQPRFRQAAPDVQQAYERQAAQVDKLREASAKTAERESAALLKRADAESAVAQASQTATNRLENAKGRLAVREQQLADLVARRAEAEKVGGDAAVALTGRVEQAEARVAAQREKVAAAEERVNQSRTRSAETLARKQAELDAAAISSAAQRRAAQQALSEAAGRLGGLAGQVGPSAAGQRTQAIQQVEAAQSVLNRAYYAEQEALGRVGEATRQASAAKVALAGVARTAGNTLSGMISIMGGPLGAALTAASVGLLGYELYQARAAASAEKHSEALGKLTIRMRDIASQTEAGQSRTAGERLADTVTNRDALRGVRDRRDKVLDNFQAAQTRAENEVSSLSAQLPGGAINSLDAAAQRLGINLSQAIRDARTLSPATDEAVRASQALATVLEEVARTDPRYAERAVEARKLANEQAAAAETARKFAEAQKANDELAGRTGSRQAVYDGEGLGPLTRSPRVSAEETAAEIKRIEAYAKTVGASLQEIGGQSYDFPDLMLLREQLQGAVKDIATVRAQAPGMLSGFSVPPALLDVVQAFSRGQESAEGYAQRLRELREANPNFVPLIDSLLKANDVALKASAQIDSVGARVDALDGKSAEVNILVRTTSLASVKIADAKEVEDQTAAAEKAMSDLQAKTYNLQLRAKGETARAKAIELQGSNPGLDLRAATEEIRKQEALEERIAALGRKGRAGGRKSPEQRSAETLSKKLEELDQDASVAALNDFDQKTVRFAQSAKVASEQIQAFIAAAKSGDLSGVPPVMQEIYDKMRLLEGVKLGKAALDGIFPGRLLAEQIESVRRAAATSPDIAANLDLIIERMRAAAAPEWAKSAAGSISNFAESAITDFDNIGQAANALLQDLIKIALRAAVLKPLEQSIEGFFGGMGGSSGGGFGGLLTSIIGAAAGGGDSPTGGVRLFAQGGIVSGPGTGTSDSIVARISNGEAIIPARVVATNRPLVQALVSDRLPKFAAGKMPDPAGFSAAVRAGEAQLSARPQIAQAQALAGAQQAGAAQAAAREKAEAAARAEPVVMDINVSGARGNAEIMDMVTQGVAAGLARYDRALDRTLLPRINNAQRRSG